MTGCCAFRCTNRSEKGFKMYRFPSDPQRRRIWENKVNRVGWIPTSSSLLCQVHFEETQFESGRADGKKKLKRLAVPTLFSHRKSPKPRKSPRKRRSASTSPAVNSPKRSCLPDHTYCIGPADKKHQLQVLSLADETEILSLRRERDELLSLIDKLERHMTEIQTSVKVLTSERNKFNLLYQQANDELQRLRQEVVKSPKSAGVSLADQSILRRVEKERDDAIADLRRVTTERDSLRERLKAEQERSSRQSHVSTRQAMITTLDGQLRTQVLRIEEAIKDASASKAQASKMRPREQTMYEDAKEDQGVGS